jgi:hypothetical protein
MTARTDIDAQKYLQDSDSEGDEQQSAQRQGSTDSNDSTEPAATTPTESENTSSNHLEVKDAPKRKKSGGSGVSWRTISAGRSEQRTAEIEALRANLQKRGRLISFSSHAVTDEGNRVPLMPSYERPRLSARGRADNRGKSPPRRIHDTRPSADEELPNQGPVITHEHHDNYTTKAFPGMTNVEIRVQTTCH